MNSRPVIEILREIGIKLDRETQKVVKILEKIDYINENDLADNLEVKINDVRKSLYVLSGLGLANYVKIKDENKKWWYVYNWKLEKSRIHYKYMTYLQDQLHIREKKLAQEQEYAFECVKTKCKMKFRYHEGLEQNFICLKCGGVLKEVRNKNIIIQLSKEIEEFLSKINYEKDKIEKQRMKEAEEEKRIKELAEKVAEKEKEDKKAKVKAEKLAKKEKLAKSVKKPLKKPLKKVVRKPVKKPIKKVSKKRR